MLFLLIPMAAERKIQNLASVLLHLLRSQKGLLELPKSLKVLKTKLIDFYKKLDQVGLHQS